ncbi:hypothetical protein [Flavobacterium sp.]|uniref:hypothetical protein n=1 Tax=Flavobacterium sp. TaxID=239 RepID=UPI0025EECA1B|nr:hypothetical protein [Flavobacterium sp.]
MHKDYYNPLGLIFDGHIYLNKKDALIRLECNQVRKIFLKKEKAISNNIILLITGLMLLTLMIIFSKHIPFEFKIAGYFLTSAVVISALLIKHYDYKIIITTKDQNVIKTYIQPEYKTEALELIRRIKQNTKPKETILKAI